MKTAFRFAILAAVLVVAPSRSFALWDVELVSKKRAAELGMEVRSTSTGTHHVRVELEFQTAGELKNYSGDDTGRTGRVELRTGQQNNPPLTVSLREDRSKAGRVVVEFTANVAQLEGISLSVMVPGELGGSIYDLRVKDFVEMGKRESDPPPAAKNAAGPTPGSGRYQMLVWGVKENPYLVLVDTQTGEAWSRGFAGESAGSWENLKTPPSRTDGPREQKRP